MSRASRCLGSFLEVVLLPGAEFAQYGLAMFAVAGLIYLVDRWAKSKGENDLAEVVQNNTKALENLTTLIQVAMTRQEAKIDELLERARR